MGNDNSWKINQARALKVVQTAATSNHLPSLSTDPLRALWLAINVAMMLCSDDNITAIVMQ
jgi:hypothetical protein